MCSFSAHGRVGGSGYVYEHFRTFRRHTSSEATQGVVNTTGGGLPRRRYQEQVTGRSYATLGMYEIYCLSTLASAGDLPTEPRRT